MMRTLIFSVAAVLVTVSDGASVTSLTPSCGSLGGETRITIYGSGFSADQFSQNNDPNKGNKVYLVSATGKQYECPVHKDGSTKNQVMCYTPQRMNEEDYYVQVVVDGTTVENSNLCGGNPTSSSCTYKPQKACTPTIDTLSPLSGYPGTFVTMKGVLFSDRLLSKNNTASNNRTEKVKRVYFGARACELQMSGNDTLYGLSLDNTTTDYGMIKCKTQGSSIGLFNGSFIIETPYGRSKPDPKTLHVSYNDKIHMYSQYTKITGISAHAGSVAGGLNLTICANYIDDRPPYVALRAYVGDEVCRITQVKIDECVSCEVSPDPKYSASSYPGGRGVNFEYWTSTTNITYNDIQALTSSSPGYHNTILQETYFDDVDNTMDNYVSRMKGFFFPPHSGVYEFWLRADDGGKVFVDGTDYVTSENNEWAVSQKVTLDSSKSYPLEIVHYESTGSSSVHLKVKYFNTTFTSASTGLAENEVQNISVTSQVKYEIQDLEFNSFTTQSHTNEVQNVMINASTNGEFRFCLLGVCTVTLTTSNSDTDMGNAIDALPIFGTGEGVNVLRLSTSTPTYQVTFDSKRGSFPDLTVRAKAGGPSVNFTVVKSVTGVPGNDIVALSLDGRVSNPFSVASLDSQAVENAASSLFEALCPTLFSSSSSSVQEHYESFEVYPSKYSGLRVKDTEPFCGRYSLQAPGYMYRKDNQDLGILMSTSGKLCFAYKGSLQNYIRVTFSYKPSATSATQTLARNFDFKTSAAPVSQTWSYVCLDLHAKLQTKFTGGLQFRLQRVYVYNSTWEQDGYVDSVFIGQKDTTNDREVNRLRLPSALSNKMYINQVSVRSLTASKYEVTLKPFECGNQLPLLTLANGVKSSGNPRYPSSSVKYALAGGNGAAITTTRTSNASPPPIGSFDVTFKNKTITNLNASLEAPAFDTALESLNGIGELSVTKDGDCANYNLTVTFDTLAGDQEQMKVSNVNLSPTGSSVSASTVIDGGLFYDPLMPDIVRTPHNLPQATLFVNDVLAACPGNCSFQWLNEYTPTVTSVTPATGTLALNTVVTISGTGFSTENTNNTVTIGGVACVVSASTATSITCAVGNGPIGQYNVTVNVVGKGNSGGNVLFTYVASISTISPGSGSIGGGITLTIDGYGFGSGANVTINNAVCAIKSVQPNQITCVIPPMVAGTYPVKVNQGGSALTYSSFTYDASKTAVISSVTPATLPVTGGRLTIAGTSFTQTPNSVFLGTVSATVVSWTDTQIVVDVAGAAPGTPQVLVNTSNGFATDGSWLVPTINVNLVLTNVFPLSGSIQGGTNLTVTGFSFGTNSSIVRVKAGNTDCEHSVVTDTKIICKLGNGATTHRVFNNGTSSYTPFAFNPKQLTIRAGDSVQFEWSTPAFVQKFVHDVLEVDSPSNTSRKVGGFGNGNPSRNGQYTKQFTQPGNYTAWSGFIDLEYNVTGYYFTLEVLDAQSWMGEVSVTVGGFEAVHNKGGASDPVETSSCSPITSQIASCTDSRPTGGNSSKFNYEFWTCKTPSINSVNVRNGTDKTNIILSGEGLSTSACQNEVSFGGHKCDVTSSNETSITCKLAQSGEPELGSLLPLAVRVVNRGNALVKIMAAEKYSFGLLPSIHSITPAFGSMAGFTRINITGFGFGDSPSVEIGGSSCKVIESSYTNITCESPPSTSATERDLTVKAYIGNAPLLAKCETTSKTCKFTYATLWTPTVASITPDAISGAATFSIVGTNLGTDPSELNVTIGGVTAEVTAAVGTSLTAQVLGLPAGDMQVTVRVKNYGKASGALTVASTLTVTGVTPSSGSINGGTNVTVAGNGFNASDITVSFGGTPCDIVATTWSAVKCTTRAHVAGSVDVAVATNGKSTTFSSYQYSTSNTPTITSIIPTSGLPGDVLTITGSNFGTDKTAVNVSLDGAVCLVTAIISTEIKCTLGNHSMGSTPVSVHVAGSGLSNNDLNFQYSLSLASINPTEGSVGGGQTVVVSGAGFDNSTVVTVCGNTCSKIQTTSSVYTCRTPASTAQTCDVVATANTVSRTLTNSYTYSSAISSSLTAVTPKRCGTGGGCSITITGSGFGTVSSDVEVKIDNAACVVTGAVIDTQIVCVAGQHPGSIDTKVEVQVFANGIASEGSSGAADFSYIDVWSSTFTWGGGPIPEAGEFVIVPSGMKLLLDTNTPVLKFLLIQGGQLIFDEKDIELQSEMILITDGGLLQVGTEAEPFQHKAIITMYGHPRSQELPIYGAKTIGVRNGTLELHGKPVAQTWTRLASTAAAGSNTITLEQAVEWNVGDEIVIATTSHRHSQSENEKKKITNKSADSKTLTLDSNLEADHFGVSETFAGREVHFRAEVGLLTHNVVVRGSSNPQWHDAIEACPDGFDTGEFATQTCFQGRFGDEIGSDQFGAAIMVSAPVKDQNLAQARISHVEVTYAGQAFRLGRYPIHFHLNGNMSGSYVRGCGIHQTFNRAVNIHGTHNMLVEHTVIYHIMGGAFFLEDGIETGNTFQYNLAIFVIASSSLLNDDVTPAAFWITNPNNTVRHNAAAGGTHFGYWYRMLENPDGPSFSPNIFPKTVPLGEFFNNSAHSLGWFALWIFPDYYPEENASVVEPAIFNTVFGYNNEKCIECVNCAAVQFVNCICVQNEKAGIEGKKILKLHDVFYAASKIHDSLIVGTTSVIPNAEQGCTKGGIILGYGQGFIVENVTFVNFAQSSCAAFRWARIDGTCGHFCGGYTYYMKNLGFVNADNKVWYEWEWEGILKDLDGSLTTKTGWSVIPTTGTLPGDCQDAPEFSIGPVKASICPDGYKWHAIVIGEVTPSGFAFKNITLTNQNGASDCAFAEKRVRFKNAVVCGVQDGTTALLEFKDSGDLATSNMSMYLIAEHFEPGDYMYLQWKSPEEPNRFSRDGGLTFINATAGSLNPVTDQTGNWTYDSTDKLVTFLINSKTSITPGMAVSSSMTVYSTDSVTRLLQYKCPYPDCIPPNPDAVPVADSRPDDFMLWDNLALWNSSSNDTFITNAGGNYGVPRDLNDVKILNGTWVVVNKTTTFNKLGILYVAGVLEFFDAPGAHYYLEADYIVIVGGRLIIGWPNDPFDGLAEIVLRGNQSSDLLNIGDGPALSTKAIGVFGGLDLTGKDKGPTWTELQEKAPAGSGTIKLADPVGWEVGDEIVISTTSFNPWETEVRKITAKASDSVTLTLNSTLLYPHTSHQETLTNGHEIKFGAGVGLLTHNIKIIGQEYSQMYTESFGARVLVSVLTDATGQSYTGWARLSNVEFYKTGQEGFTDSFDPRFSLAYLNTGTVSELKPSSVHACSYHNGFSPAIGVFGVGNLNITENVAYGTVGSAYVVSGDGQRIVKNLAALVVNPATYQDRFETYNMAARAAFEVSDAANLAMEDNLAAGAEGIAYHPPMNIHYSSNNKAISSVVAGVAILPEDTTSTTDCAEISGYTVIKTHDYGIYYQNEPCVIVKNISAYDNRNGLIAFVYAPDPIQHLCATKPVRVVNSTFVGQTDSFDCNTDVTPTNDDNYRITNQARYKGKLGNTGILLPTFMTKDNGLPTHPWGGIMSYPTICGRTYLENVTLAKFQDTSCKRNYALMFNVQNDDGTHPTVLKSTTLIQVDDTNKVRIPRPNIGKINSADCIDMDCDGLKKGLLKDLDGTFLGHKGDVIPHSEFEWDENPARGLGDYRIPKTLLTSGNGDRITCDTMCPKKGIIRNENCVYRPSWQAYECQADMNYEMLIIESMDVDTETRRLSPLAILGEGYIDLINGPQDHGWCSGYTCRKRLSTFMALVATGKNYQMHFTSVTPLQTRFRLLDSVEGIKMTYYSSRPNRMDIYVNGVFAPAKNSDTVDGRYILKVPTGTEYDPQISDGTGANYHDRQTGDFTFIVLGSDVIDVKAEVDIIVSLRLPGQTVDEFFGENIAYNLARYLDIPLSKIRVASIVSASSRRRRKRSAEDAIVTIEIANGPNTYLNETDTAEDSLSYAELLDLGSAIVNECQAGNLSVSFNITGACESVSLPSSDSAIASVVYESPAVDHLFFSEQPVAMHEGALLQTQPKIRAADVMSTVIPELGTDEFPWQITASLRAGTGHPNAVLSGALTVSSSGGWFNFTDLVISHMGDGYILDFYISYPTQAENITLASEPFDVAGRPVQIHVLDLSSGDIVRDSLFFIKLVLQDSYTEEIISDIGWRDHTWTVEARMLESSEYASLGGTLTSAFDSSSGQVMFPDLTFTGFGIYYIQFTVVSDPPDYSLTLSQQLFVKSPDHVGMPIEEEYSIQIMFDADFDTILPTKDLQNGFNQMLLTIFANMWTGVYIGSGASEKGSIVVTFSIAGTYSDVNETAYCLCDSIYNETSFSYNGYSLTLSSFLSVDGQQYYGVKCGDLSEDEDEDEGTATYVIAVAVLVPLLLIIVVLVVLIWKFMIKPKTQTHAPRIVKPIAGNMKFNFTSHGTHYNGSTQKKVDDKEYLFKDNSFVSLRGINVDSPVPAFSATVGNSQLPRYDYIRDTPSPISPPQPMKQGLDSKQPNWTSTRDSRVPRQDAAPTAYSLQVPVSPNMDQLAPRPASSHSGRASPMLHGAMTPERENSMPPVGEDTLSEKF